LLAIVAGAAWYAGIIAKEPVMISDRVNGAALQGPVEKATFGAGCFWHVEDAFRKLPGVVATSVGYAGGTLQRPTYEDVCSDTTGHAEVVEVQFDPARVSYETLLALFWDNHDPTTPNRQGPDVGSQYRSAIFYHDESQRRAAEASKSALAESGRFRRPIVTQIAPAPMFWRAEDYHQQYFEKRGWAACGVR
jgi:peptide-methionine (S)-S-oxide reductase